MTLGPGRCTGQVRRPGFVPCSAHTCSPSTSFFQGHQIAFPRLPRTVPTACLLPTSQASRFPQLTLSLDTGRKADLRRCLSVPHLRGCVSFSGTSISLGMATHTSICKSVSGPFTEGLCDPEVSSLFTLCGSPAQIQPDFASAAPGAVILLIYCCSLDTSHLATDQLNPCFSYHSPSTSYTPGPDLGAQDRWLLSGTISSTECSFRLCRHEQQRYVSG